MRLKAGDVASGVVAAIRHYGVHFLLTGGERGLLLVVDCGLERGETPVGRFNIGQMHHLRVTRTTSSNEIMLSLLPGGPPADEKLRAEPGLDDL